MKSQALNGDSAAPRSRSRPVRILSRYARPRSDRLLVVPERLPEIHAVVGKIRFRYLRISAGRLPVEVALVDDRAPDRGAVAPDHLGERVHGDVGPVLERVEERGRRDRVVDDQRQLVLVRHLGDGLEIVHVALRVADGLGVEQPGVLVDGPLEVGRVARIDKAGFDPEALERERELGVGAAVELVAGHEVLAHRGDGRDGVEDGGLAGSRGQGAGGAVKGREPLLEHLGGGIGQPGVEIAELLEGEEVRGVLAVAEHVAAGLIDGDRPGERLLVGGMARRGGPECPVCTLCRSCQGLSL